ncbi:MAG: hypothetical protein J3K34DRAFT_411239 [Monoraphidium minutum]|nr:MAG: hypothetical protein J3K34DRAFT_411239 [Monoraphidium minutum]
MGAWRVTEACLRGRVHARTCMRAAAGGLSRRRQCNPSSGGPSMNSRGVRSSRVGGWARAWRGASTSVALPGGACCDGPRRSRAGPHTRHVCIRACIYHVYIKKVSTDRVCRLAARCARAPRSLPWKRVCAVGSTHRHTRHEQPAQPRKSDGGRWSLDGGSQQQAKGTHSAPGTGLHCLLPHIMALSWDKWGCAAKRHARGPQIELPRQAAGIWGPGSCTVAPAAAAGCRERSVRQSGWVQRGNQLVSAEGYAIGICNSERGGEGCDAAGSIEGRDAASVAVVLW